MSERGRVVVVGMDGLSWSVVDELMARGELPAFRSLIDEGRHAVLESTLPPLTPAAWSTMFSGLPPARHGMFDFTAREWGSYSFRLCTSRDRRAEMLWSLASSAGRRVVVLNVPMTAPADEVNGIMVSGMDARDLGEAVSPRRELARVLSAAPRYTIDVMAHWYDDPQLFSSRLYDMHRERHRLAVSLLDELAPDLFICVYVLADRVQHAAWSWPVPVAVGDAYRALDGVLADYLERRRGRDHLLVVSDHGFQGLRAEVCLNRVLAEAGLLRLGRSARRRRCRLHDLGMVHTRNATRAPEEDAWRLPPRALWFDDVDWRHTRCAAFGLGGNLMLNLRGRDREGIVASAAEGEAVLERAAAEIRARLRPSLGELEVTVHPTGCADAPGSVSPPDAVVEIDGFRVATWGGREFYAPGLTLANAEGFCGTHSLEGVFAAAGPELPPARERGRLRLVDVTPSIAQLMGLETAAELPGSSFLES